MSTPEAIAAWLPNTLRAFIVLATLACGTAVAANGDDSREPRPPNIVLIFGDDLGWADLPSYGNKITSTPNIDALAKEGMRFTHFYAAPVCSPSRAELQSGQYAARLGITDFIPGHWRPFEKVITPRPALSYPAGTITMGEALHRRGYATGYFGKWHLGDPRVQPSDRGYQETWVSQGYLTSDGKPTIGVIGERAVSFLDRHRAAPFLLLLSPFQPHVPLRADPKKIEKYAARLANAQASLPDPMYAAMIEDLDDLVGRVTHKLDELKLTASTLVVFASDNGGLEYLDLGLNDRVTSNAPLRGEKGTVYEGGIRVPLIARWPKTIKPHVVQDTPAAMYDLLPTFLDVAGAAKSERERFDGRSLVPALRGSAVSASEERALYFHYPHYHHGRPASAVILRPWKLIEYLDDGSLELYRLSRDMSERQNMATALPDVAQRLRNILAAWREQVGARLPTPNPEYDAAKAKEWWDFNAKKPLDMKSIRKALQRGELQPAG